MNDTSAVQSQTAWKVLVANQDAGGGALEEKKTRLICSRECQEQEVKAAAAECLKHGHFLQKLRLPLTAPVL